MNISSRRKLHDGTEMPFIGYGTARLQGDLAQQGTHWALNAGYRHIDTASYYQNENAIGEAINSHRINREEIYLVSKIWPAEFNDPRSAIKKSLNKLNVEYLNLYLIHWPDTGNRWLEVWNELIQFRDEGLVNSIGVSSFSFQQIEVLSEETSVLPVVNQIEMSPFHYNKEQELLGYCKSKDIFITSFSPLGEGKALNHKLVSAMAQKYDVSAAQLLLKWGIMKHFSVIPKSKNKKRIEENIDLYHFKLNDEDIRKLDTLG